MHFTDDQRKAWASETRDSPFNVWLRARVSTASGQLDLVALREVADEFDVDWRPYQQLNLGQQRMNIGNRLRKCVPSSTYTSDAVESRSASVVISPDIFDLSGFSNSQLMQIYGDVIDELKGRRVIRTANAPLGDYAEHLCAKAFGWTLSNNSAAGYDAIDAAGMRFQIKARRIKQGGAGERQLSAIRALPEARFDMLAAILFDRQFNIVRAAFIPHAIVVKRSSYAAHVNGWRFMLQDSVWDETGVRDVTSDLTPILPRL